MSVQKFTNEKIDVESTKPTRPEFISHKSIEWTPWVIDGTHFKLFAVDTKTGGFTFMLRIAAGTVAPIHGHIGGVEGIITKGWFAYSDESRGDVGDYVCEDGGIRHIPYTDDETEVFVVAHGPLAGYNPDGSIASIVSAKEMLQMATDAGQADHIDVSFPD
ncbi:MAG: cupin domain-containing protein [Pseudomonadota bacterium]